MTATDTRFDRAALLTLLFATLLVRTAAVRADARAFTDDIDDYQSIAESVAREGLFGFWGRPTAFRPPLYPLVLASLDKCGLLNAAGLVFLHLALGIATVWLVSVVGRQWGLGRRRFLAGALVAIDPILLRQSTLIMTETLAAFLAAAGLCTLTALVSRPTTARAVGTGAILGLTVLCRPAFLLWVAAAPLAVAWLLPTVAPRGRTAALVLLAIAVVLSPWGMRNALRFGRPMITTTNGGWTMFLANNLPFYRHMLTDPLSPWDAGAFNSLLIDPTRTAVKDEMALDRKYYGYAWGCIREQPMLFAFSVLYRESRLWGVMPLALAGRESWRARLMRYGIGVFYSCEMALMLVGVWSLGRKCFDSPWLFGVLLAASFTAVHALYWTDLRMRAPMVPAIACAAAAGIAWICGKLPQRKVQAG